MDTPPPPLPPPLPPPAVPPPFQPGYAPWPMVPVYQPVVDAEHLKLLSIFHYIVGALAILFSSIFIFHIVIGLLAINQKSFFTPSSTPRATVSPAPADSPDEAVADGQEATPAPTINHRLRRLSPVFPDAPPTPPINGHLHRTTEVFPDKFFGYMFLGMGSAAVGIGWTFGALTIYSGNCIARRRRRVFSMVIAGFNCLHVPLGTALGVFTFVVLGRPTVAALYAANRKVAA